MGSSSKIISDLCFEANISSYKAFIFAQMVDLRGSNLLKFYQARSTRRVYWDEIIKLVNPAG